MKRHEKWFAGCGLMAALVASACSGTSTTATAVETPTVQVAASETPTVGDPVPAVSNDERVATAVAQLNADVAVGIGPAGTIAFDLLESSIDPDGNVTLTICAWTGDTVFDSVRASLYRTKVDANGTITATHVTSPVAPGECLNSHLINTALDFIDEFERYSSDASADPAIVNTDPRVDTLLTESFRSRTTDRLNGLADDGVYFEPSFIASDVRTDRVADILYRRYLLEDLQILEFVVCRPMNPDSGSYRDGVLIDDGRRPEFPGFHAIDAYQLVADPAADLRWRITGDEGLIWADCFETGDWPGAANVWRPRDSQLQVLQ